MLVKNRKTGVESKMTEEQWKKTQANTLWAGVFVPVISEPKEVQKLKETKATGDGTPKTSDRTAK